MWHKIQSQSRLAPYPLLDRQSELDNVANPRHFPEEDLNEAALRRTHSRVAEATVEMI